MKTWLCALNIYLCLVCYILNTFVVVVFLAIVAPIMIDVVDCLGSNTIRYTELFYFLFHLSYSLEN